MPFIERRTFSEAYGEVIANFASDYKGKALIKWKRNGFVQSATIPAEILRYIREEGYETGFETADRINENERAKRVNS